MFRGSLFLYAVLRVPAMLGASVVPVRTPGQTVACPGTGNSSSPVIGCLWTPSRSANYRSSERKLHSAPFGPENRGILRTKCGFAHEPVFPPVSCPSLFLYSVMHLTGSDLISVPERHLAVRMAFQVASGTCERLLRYVRAFRSRFVQETQFCGTGSLCSICPYMEMHLLCRDFVPTHSLSPPVSIPSHSSGR